MKNIILIMALLCLCLNTGVSQSPVFRSFSTSSGVLGTLQSMPTNAIADDFGPRNLAKTYWHGGVDFNMMREKSIIFLKSKYSMECLMLLI